MPEITSQLSTALTDRYKIERHIGEGGMATVYLAHDVKHDRKVALKVLRPELAAVIGAERFLQEIKVTANLQHPHILPLHDSGDAGSFLYYVMPYIEGDTLRDKLDREKQLAIEDAIEITRSIASALDYAHRQGVIHRDIKPENILLHDGQAMVADFGIALAVSEASGKRLTETGLSIGTPHYMSPEQAMGDRELDARSDIYSLGAMLYEMLAGDPPYQGSSAQAIVAKVITEKAPPVTAARDTVPGHINAAIVKALNKMPADRFSTAAAFADALTNVAFTVPTTATAEPAATPVTTTPLKRFGAPAGFAALAIVALWGWFRSPPDLPSPQVTRLDLSLGGIVPWRGADVVISPDGSMLAISGLLDGGAAIFVRPIGDAEFRPVPGTEGGMFPVFSPDGAWLAFRDTGENALVRVAVSGGGTLTLEDVGYDAHWGDDGTLVFVQGQTLAYIPSVGGPSVPLSVSGRTPFMLPDGSGVVYQAGQGAGLHYVDLATDSSWQLHPEGHSPAYVESGHILFVASSNDLFALPFDIESHQVTGPPARALDGVAEGPFFHAGYSVSRTGTLVHHEGAGTGGLAPPNLVVIHDFAGTADTLPLPPGSRRAVQFSPDGRSIAYEIVTRSGDHDLYTFDLISRANQQITFANDNDAPVWSPDGTRLLFDVQGDSTLGEDVWLKAADNSANAEEVLRLPGNQDPLFWIDDDRFVFSSSETGNGDLFVYSFADSGNVEPYLQAPWQESSFALSPDGDVAAVVTSETGINEVWLREFPVPEGKWRVSFGGGQIPRWSPDGRTLYFRRTGESADTIFAVVVDRNPAVVVRDAEVAFVAPTIVRWDLHPDGERFLVVVPAPTTEVQVTEQIDRYLVVLNWFEELKERIGND